MICFRISADLDAETLGRFQSGEVVRQPGLQQHRRQHEKKDTPANMKSATVLVGAAIPGAAIRATTEEFCQTGGKQ